MLHAIKRGGLSLPVSLLLYVSAISKMCEKSQERHKAEGSWQCRKASISCTSTGRGQEMLGEMRGPELGWGSVCAAMGELGPMGAGDALDNVSFYLPEKQNTWIYPVQHLLQPK